MEIPSSKWIIEVDFISREVRFFCANAVCYMNTRMNNRDPMYVSADIKSSILFGDKMLDNLLERHVHA